MIDENLAAGVFSGIVQTVVGHPLDTFKVWKQQRLRPVMSHMYRGIKYPLLTNPLLTGTQFSFADEIGRISGIEKRVLADTFGGALSGVASGACLAPIDRYKIALQSTSRKPQYGLLSCLVREIPASAIYFGSYSAMRENDIPVFAAGSAAGVLSWLLTYPLDIIKTQVQSGESRTIREAARKIHSGQVSRFAGLGVCMLRAIVTNGIGFVAYEETKNIKKYNMHI